MAGYTEDQYVQRRQWAKQAVAKRKSQALAYLGGKCVSCGTTENLEFDHIDRSTKSFTISSGWNYRWEIFAAELDKCQLLCHDCHLTKTKEHHETGGGWNKKADIPHGTPSGYTYWRCRCDECQQARRDYVGRGNSNIYGGKGRYGTVKEHGAGTKGVKDCKCSLCKARKAEYMRELRSK